MGALGVAFGELDRWAEAINFHTSALYIAREVHDREEEALQLASLGYACMRGGQLPQALLRYRQALHLAYQSGDRNNIVSTIVDLVRLLMRSPRHLSVCELLVEDALNYDSMDKDLIQLEEEIAQQKLTILNTGTPLTEIRGTAQDYAANAYKLLDE
jgi:tetratricopeptide (TPR) repeat protein